MARNAQTDDDHQCQRETIKHSQANSNSNPNSEPDLDPKSNKRPSKACKMSDAVRLTIYIILPLISSSSLIYKTTTRQQQSINVYEETSHASHMGPADQMTMAKNGTLIKRSQRISDAEDNLQHQLAAAATFWNSSSLAGNCDQHFKAEREGQREVEKPLTQDRRRARQPSLNLLDADAGGLDQLEQQANGGEQHAHLSQNFGAKIVIFIISSLVALVVGATVYDRNQMQSANGLAIGNQKDLDRSRIAPGSGTADPQPEPRSCPEFGAAGPAAALAAASPRAAGGGVATGSSFQLSHRRLRLRHQMCQTSSRLRACGARLSVCSDPDLEAERQYRSAARGIRLARCEAKAHSLSFNVSPSSLGWNNRDLIESEAQSTDHSQSTTTSLPTETNLPEAAATINKQKKGLILGTRSMNRAFFGRRRLGEPTPTRKTTTTPAAAAASGGRGANANAAATTFVYNLTCTNAKKTSAFSRSRSGVRSRARASSSSSGALANNNNNKNNNENLTVASQLEMSCESECRRGAPSRATSGEAPATQKTVITSEGAGKQQQEQQRVAFNNLVKEIILSFSVYKNASLIFNNKTKPTTTTTTNDAAVEGPSCNRVAAGEENTDCLHGLRLISMLWVIMIHSYSFALDLLNFERDPRMEPFNIYKTYMGQMLSNGSFACDTFLMIAGFLLAFISIEKLTSSSRKQPKVGRTSDTCEPPSSAASHRYDCDSADDAEREAGCNNGPSSTMDAPHSSKPLSSLLLLIKSSSMSSLDSGLSDDCSQSSESSPPPSVIAQPVAAESSPGSAPGSASSAASSLDLGWPENDDSFSDSASSLSSSSSSPAKLSDACRRQRSRKDSSSSQRWLRHHRATMNQTDADNDDDLNLNIFKFDRRPPSPSHSLDLSVNNNNNHQQQAGFTLANMVSNMLHRYLRTMPVMMAIIALNTNLLAYFGSGPKYNSSTMMFDRWCRTNWWLNLIFIHNFSDTRHMCLGHSWYSAVDFQLFIAGQILLFIFYKLHTYNSTKRRGADQNKSGAWTLGGNCNLNGDKHTLRHDINNNSSLVADCVNSAILKYKHLILTSVCLLLIFASQLYTGVITYIYKLPMIPMMPNFSLESNLLYCVKIYIKPYCRASPYFIGFLLAYYMRLNIQKGKVVKLKRWQVLFGWSLSLTTMLAIVLTTTPIFNGIMPNNTFIALYGSLARPIWSCSIGWIIFACITNNGGFLAKLLATKYLIPFSRLTYPVYLIHPVIIAAFYGSRQSYFEFSHYLMFCLIFGFIVITYASAFIFSLVFELPVQSVEKAITKYNQSRKEIERKYQNQYR